MIWIILGLTIAAVFTAALLAYDLRVEAAEQAALDDFDFWFKAVHGREPKPIDYLNYLYPEAEVIE